MRTLPPGVFFGFGRDAFTAPETPDVIPREWKHRDGSPRLDPVIEKHRPLIRQRDQEACDASGGEPRQDSTAPNPLTRVDRIESGRVEKLNQNAAS